MSALRLRSVRFKTGAEIRVLRSEADSIGSTFRRHAREMADSEQRMAGFAIVVWDHQGSSTVSILTGRASPIVGVGIPDFVRGALVNYKARVDAEKDILGPSKPPAS